MNCNDVLEASILMSKTEFVDTYEGYWRNEIVWSTRLINHISGALTGDPAYVAIKDVDAEGKMRGFMIASTFACGYTGESVMDVKDVIVDYKLGRRENAKTVEALFSKMIDHLKEYGGKQWRADSIHSYKESKAYAEFLKKRFNCTIRFSAKGEVK